jgi:hypothetical protein
MAKRMIDKAEVEEAGISRRDLLRRAAIVGGSVVWMAPAIQTLTPRAYADVSPGVSTCCQCKRSTGQGRCFANDPTANTLASCTSKCQAQTSPTGWTIDEFHQDFPAGSGKTFSCTGSGNTSFCSPVPH